ncbi:MAG: phosphatidylglycerophosphatase A [Alphaproteobacteria bacterium]|nr:phosphatidylglycerophosphatase A [Alphaproteobacteria bacterium]MBR4315896.1 phosphatidylglycerophosphatase A [Alphaproteobacteria bacterium]
MKKTFAYIVASLFGVGFAPVASGTFGSLASFILIVPSIYFDGLQGILALFCASFFLGWLASRVVLRYTEHDPGLIVIDETAGQTITFVFVSKFLSSNFSYWYLYILGFALFRLFDITKPLFIGVADRKIENAFGVMFDDVLAGIVSAICLYAITLFI